MKTYKTRLIETYILTLLKEFISTKIDETSTSFRVRQKEPSEFSFFRTIALGKGKSKVKAVVGKLKSDPSKGMQIQTLIFPKTDFPNEEDVKNWLEKNS